MGALPEIKEFENCLKGSFGKNWKYLNHSSTNLTAPGENYGSVILKVDVEYEENNNKNKVGLVAKLCPPSEILKEAFACSVTFKKEIQAYLIVCPLIETIQIEYNIPEEQQLDFFAKCYGARMNLSNEDKIDNDALIILENLKLQGYFVEDRMEGLDLPTTELILINLAKLHAVIIAIRLFRPNEFKEKVVPCLMSANNGGVMIDGFVGAAVKLLETIDDCKQYVGKVKKIKEERGKLGSLMFPFTSNIDFYTIVHTDFWINNMMVMKNDKGEPLKAKMIDLQLTDYGSGIRDLLFFLYTSVQQEICEKYFDHFIKMYHKNFVEFLSYFNCDLTKYSWEIFMKELNEVAPHELFHLLFMLKPIFSEPGSIESLESIDVSEFARIDNLGNVYLSKLRQIIISYAQKNWL